MENFKSSLRWGLQPQGGCSRTCGGGSQVVHDDGDGDGDGDGIKQAISIFLEEKLCENVPLLTVIDNCF